MFIPELLGDPDEGRGTEPCGIGEDLPEVGVIRSANLVLDHHPTVLTGLPALDVRGEGPD